MADSRQDQAVALVFGGLVGLAFLVGVLFVDAKILWGLSSQFQSSVYPHVPGRIVRSQVVSEAGNRRRLSTHAIELNYQYQVDGKSYESSNYRFTKTMSHNEDAVRKTVAELPPGREVEVYHDPRNPAEAVLAPGLNTSDFILLHLLVPFNGVVAFVLIAAWNAWRSRYRPAGGASFVEGVDEIRVRTGHFTPAQIALFFTSLVSLAVAVALMVFADIDVSPIIAGVAWLSVPIAFVGFYLRYRSRGEIVLDSRSGTITLPISRDRTEMMTVPWSEVTGMGVSEVVGVNKQGAATGKSYAVELNWTESESGAERSETLARWETRDLAKALLLWLRPRIMGSTWVSPQYRDVEKE